MARKQKELKKVIKKRVVKKKKKIIKKKTKKTIKKIKPKKKQKQIKKNPKKVEKLKKGYFPGQKKDTPQDGTALKIFYQSYYGENPKSKFAQEWLLKHGLLPLNIAKKFIKLKC